MDEFAWQSGIPALPDVGFGPAGALAVANGGTATAIPGGQVERRQQRAGDRLSQVVEIRRRDGSVWTAYAREVDLPADPGEAQRTAEEASHVLALLAQAVVAADRAREARGVMLGWMASPPAWAARYDRIG